MDVGNACGREFFGPRLKERWAELFDRSAGLEAVGRYVRGCRR